MTKEQVQMLRDAGISETAIIDRILSEETRAEPEPEAPDPEPKEQPTPEPQPEQQDQREDAILKAIEKLTGAIFAQNGRTLGRETDEENSVENILRRGFYEPEVMK